MNSRSFKDNVMTNLISEVSSDRQGYVNCLNAFLQPSLRSQQGISLARAAYQLLESVAQWILQQSGEISKVLSEDQLPIELQELTAPMRGAIVRGVCVFMEMEINGTFHADSWNAVITIADRLIDTEHGRGTNLPSRLEKLRSQIATAS